MKFNDFYNLILKYNMITPVWKYELKLIEDLMDIDDKDNYLILFSIYFCLINLGNVCMSLDKNNLINKFNEYINNTDALAKDKINDYNKNEINDIKNISNDVINKYLSNINNLNIVNDLSINERNIKNTIFEIEDNYLYLRKYNKARCEIIKSIKRLYDVNFNNDASFNVEDSFKDNFSLANNQKKAVIEGLNKNLIITGGPGTGKTTSILFILLYLLSNNLNYNIYLAAASGKASSRMRESIIKGIDNLNAKFKEDKAALIAKINGTLKNDNNSIEEFTIHRLLGVDFNNGGFKYNKNKQFEKNSIFVIDEASMIDICLFNDLLNAIPEGSRLFILGDKDQLPSVEVGSVFWDLVNSSYLKNKNMVIELDESRRFNSNTTVYKIADKIKNGIELENIEFKNPIDFKLEDVLSLVKDLPQGIDKCPIYYYLNDKNNKNEKKNIEEIVDKWATKFYGDIQQKCINIDLDNIKLKELFNKTEEAKILCAENEGTRGIKSINELIKNKIINKKISPSLYNHFPGEILMINKNNKSLRLYNGDSGILVSIKDDDTLYLMVEKNNDLINEGYKKDDIFKIGKYIFYPFRLLSEDDADLAFAITIHKSQGSDYYSILVILPTSLTHPLLNRQILYTAITRTKGNTYILSNLESLNSASKNIIIRDTNVIIK